MGLRQLLELPLLPSRLRHSSSSSTAKPAKHAIFYFLPHVSRITHHGLLIPHLSSPEPDLLPEFLSSKLDLRHSVTKQDFFKNAHFLLDFYGFM
jgi:hypothetical protein